MTQEQKAKAYDEALAKMQEWKKKYVDSNTLSADGTIIKDLEEIFPELRESEDERIRKVIYKLILGMREEIFTAQDEIVTKEKALAYLEKQKEPCCTEEVKKWKKELDSLCKEHYGQKSSVWDNPIMTNEMLMEKQKEQKPVNNYLEWRNIVYYVLKEWLGIGQYMDMAPFNDIVKTLQEKYSLPKPAEWSEEDEDIMYSIRSFLIQAEQSGKYGSIQIAQIEKGLNWLKSLRPQWKPTDVCYGIKGDPDPAGVWKPSKEQMNYLCAAVMEAKRKHNESVNGYPRYAGLKSLYEDLEKLM